MRALVVLHRLAVFCAWNLPSFMQLEVIIVSLPLKLNLLKFDEIVRTCRLITLRYAGVSPCKHLNAIPASPTSSCRTTGNRWSCFNMGVMWSNFLAPVATLASQIKSLEIWPNRKRRKRLCETLLNENKKSEPAIFTELFCFFAHKSLANNWNGPFPSYKTFLVKMRFIYLRIKK